MTKCKRCGYDTKKPLGRAIENSKKTKKGNFVKVKLNKNGFAYIYHKEFCK